MPEVFAVNWEDSTGEAAEFLEYFEQNLPYRDSVDLALVLLRERPACLIMDPEDEKLDKIRSFCEKFDLHIVLKKDEKGSGLSKTGVFVSREKERFELLEDSEGRFYGFSDREVGEFLGFPEEDIEYFAENIEDGPVESETREKAGELAEKGLIDREDVKFVELVTYVAKPTEECVIRAVERGKDYRDALLEFDRETGSEVGVQLLENLFSSPVA